MNRGERLKELQTKIMCDCNLAKDSIDSDSEIALYINRIESHAQEIEDVLVNE